MGAILTDADLGQESGRNGVLAVLARLAEESLVLRVFRRTTMNGRQVGEGRSPVVFNL